MFRTGGDKEAAGADTDANELADMNVRLTKCDERQEQDVAVDATQPRHLVAAAAGNVLAPLRQNLLYRNEQVVAHHTRDDLLHHAATETHWHRYGNAQHI